ncbi:MAG: glycine cleavage T C-terminal barrel domain-containing protein, partial [Planctomycetota bacterium]
APQPCRATLPTLIDKYLFSEKVTLRDLRAPGGSTGDAAAWTVVGVYGRQAREALAGMLAGGALPQEPHAIAALEGAVFGAAGGADAAALSGWILAVPPETYSAPGWELILPAAMAGQVFDALRRSGLAPIGLAALGAASLEAAHPRFGADFDDRNLPPETGLTQAYSLKKGCYIGQEVMARIQTYGHVNRQLTALLIDGAAPVPRDAEVYDGESKVGTVTSSIVSPTLNRPIALAYVARQHRAPGTKLAVKIDAAGVVGAEVRGGGFV